MSSGADLFVVCKQCGSEVSPYITECPYCGNRLRRRAPKLPRERIASSPRRGRLRRTRWLAGSARRATTAPSRLPGWGAEGRALGAPYVTIALVGASCCLWVAWRGGYVGLDKLVVAGPLHGDWWKLISSQLTYNNGIYAFAALLAVAIFGWLLERRQGPLAVIALFFIGGVAGVLAAEAVYTQAIVIGGNGAALALLGAWVAPDLRAARSGDYYEGDLIGAGALAAVLLAMPFALPRPDPSWLAGVTGGVIGLVLGLGLHRVAQGEP